MNRVFYGAVAGFCATLAMTMAMRRLDRNLEPDQRYPLPPREITETIMGSGDRREAMTVAAHFGFGAAAGALYGLMPRRLPGVIFGPLVWAASYLGWVPLGRILRPATSHPSARNRLMVAAHLVWGCFLALGLRELEAASGSVFAAGELRDSAGDEEF